MLIPLILSFAFCLLVFGYIFFIWLLSKVKFKTLEKKDILPFVTILICCHNENPVIEEKIQNTLELDYPKNKNEIIVVDSASTDGSTMTLQRYFENGSITFVKQSERLGKPSAINAGLAVAKGDIIVLTDSDAFLEATSLKKLVRNFADSHVGAVVGNLILECNNRINKANSQFYKFFRQRVRELEAEIDSASFFSGELLAFRKELVKKVDENILSDDQYILFEVRKRNYRAITEREAFVVERDIGSIWGQINHKRRTTVGTLQVFTKNWRVLFNPKYAFFGMLIAPAYLVRLIACPFLLLMLLVYAVLYAPYFLILPATILMGLGALLREKCLGLIYGIIVQLAVVLGIVDYLTGNYTVLWEKKGK